MGDRRRGNLGDRGCGGKRGRKRLQTFGALPCQIRIRALLLALGQQPPDFVGRLHASGGFHADDQSPRNAAIVVDRRPEAVGPPDILHLPVAQDGDELVLVPHGLATGFHLINLRTDMVPRVGPEFPSSSAERARRAIPLAEAGRIVSQRQRRAGTTSCLPRP